MLDPFDPLEYNYSHQLDGATLVGGAGRLKRLRFISERFDPASLYWLQDGHMSHRYISEAVECYLAGQFLGAALLAFGFLERTIAARLHHLGQSGDAKKRSEELFALARDYNWITPQEFSTLEGLRQSRNPLVHFKEPLSERRPEIQALLSAKTTAEHLESISRDTLQAAINVLNSTAL